MSLLTRNINPQDTIETEIFKPEVIDGQPDDPEKGGASLRDVLRLRNFRLLWIGEGISLIGDQFYMIALPWLVLQLTGDAFAMGTVLALAGIPRALFMLVGGALTDRFSPRLVMLSSNGVRLVLVALLATLVLTGWVQLWMLYGFALVFGLADAFFFPAQSTIVPQIVGKRHLQIANAIIQGTGQLSLFVGPILAGAMIALLDGGASTLAGETLPDMQGIGIAFAFDALTFLASAFTLWWMKTAPVQSKAGGEEEAGVLSSIRIGLTYVWNDVALRSFFILIAAANMLINSPFTVGVPFLADTRLPEGAAAFGLLMSAFGGGALLGIVLAGALPKPPARYMGVVVGLVWSAMGIATVLLGLIESTPGAALIMLGAGIANGYVTILFITWLQERTPEIMLGRVMSLFMFALIGLQPVGNALAGAILSLNPTALFVGAGSLMVTLVLLSMFNPAVRAMEPGVVEVEPA